MPKPENPCPTGVPPLVWRRRRWISLRSYQLLTKHGPHAAEQYLRTQIQESK